MDNYDNVESISALATIDPELAQVRLISPRLMHFF